MSLTEVNEIRLAALKHFKHILEVEEKLEKHEYVVDLLISPLNEKIDHIDKVIEWIERNDRNEMEQKWLEYKNSITKAIVRYDDDIRKCLSIMKELNLNTNEFEHKTRHVRNMVERMIVEIAELENDSFCIL